MHCHYCGAFNEDSEVSCGICCKPTGVPPYAGYWKRRHALFVDGVLVLILNLVIVTSVWLIGAFMHWSISTLIFLAL